MKWTFSYIALNIVFQETNTCVWRCYHDVTFFDKLSIYRLDRVIVALIQHSIEFEIQLEMYTYREALFHERRDDFVLINTAKWSYSNQLFL